MADEKENDIMAGRSHGGADPADPGAKSPAPLCTLTPGTRLEYRKAVHRARNRRTHHRVSSTMPDTLPLHSMPAVFSPLAKALLDGFSEGVVVFDVDGRLLYSNHPAKDALGG